jgi:hypothetical protein
LACTNQSYRTPSAAAAASATRITNDAGSGTECHDTGIKGETRGRRQQPRGDHRDCHSENRNAEGEADQPTDGREHEALGQQLREDARPSCPQRRPHGDLTRPDAAARQEQIGNVGAAQEQNEADDADEEERCQLQVGAHDAGPERLGGDAEVLVCRWIVLREPLSECGEIGACGLQSDTRLQASDHLKRPCAASCRDCPQSIRDLWQQRPDARRTLQLHIVGYDPNDRERLAVQPNVATDKR